MFKVIWASCDELDLSSSDFCEIVYDVSNHTIFYETCNGIKHALRCDFGSIFDKLHSIVSSEEFQNEKPYEDGCGRDWYKFEYNLGDILVKYEGFINDLKLHREVVSLVKSCAKSTLDDERKLLDHKCTDVEMQDIIKKRQELEEDFLDWWIDIEKKSEDIFYNPNCVKMRLEDDSSDCWKGILSEIQLPDGYIRCENCNSIIHNKYFKNRKYWGRDWLNDGFGDYEVEYDSGECPVCGQLNTELPYTGIEFQPDDLSDNNNDKEDITSQFDNNKVYSYNELSYLLESLSDEDRNKIKDCQFKLDEQYPDDDSGDVYDYITIFKNGNEIGKIDMQLHSNTYFDLIDMEIKTIDDTPYYTYEMTLYADSKENTKTSFDDTFDSKNPFDDSEFRCKECGEIICSCEFKCKKCGELFCTCNSFFSKKRDKM